MSKKVDTPDNYIESAELECPAFDKVRDDNTARIEGSKHKALGYGIQAAVGRDGDTKGYVVTLLALKENGKAKYTALQDTVKCLAPGYAKAYNAFTKLFKSEVAALHACSECAKAFGGYVLRNEQAVIDKMKAAGKWDIKNEGDKKAVISDTEKTDKRAKAAFENISAAPDKFAAFEGLFNRLDFGDKVAAVFPLIRTLRAAVTCSPDACISVIDKAIKDIQALEAATLTQKAA